MIELTMTCKKCGKQFIYILNGYGIDDTNNKEYCSDCVKKLRLTTIE